MFVSEQLIKILARKIFQKYVSDDSIVREVGDLLLGPEKLGEGLSNLINNRIIKLGDATEASDFRPELVDIVIRTLKQIQKDTGILKSDGVLGERTLHWLFNRPFGHHHRPIESLPKSKTTAAPDDSIHAVRYFIENDELPVVPSLTGPKTLKIFREALESWVDVCDLDVKQTGNRADANVIVNVKALSQPPSVVAIADVGPPRDRQLELSFDRAETWTPHKLQATAAHEFGHNLGLGHIGEAGQLMNDTLHDAIAAPQKFDIEAAVKIWGKRSLLVRSRFSAAAEIRA
jgi:hypothetical protein